MPVAVLRLTLVAISAVLPRSLVGDLLKSAALQLELSPLPGKAIL